MKNIKPETIAFQPTIQVYDSGTNWGISFDSGSDHDLKRESRTFWVPKKGVLRLDVRVEGFDRLGDPGLLVHTQGIAGRIKLVATYEGDILSEYLLAECDLSPWAQHRALKFGDAVGDVADAVRNGTVAAFTTVVTKFFTPTQMSAFRERVREDVEREKAATSGEGVRSLGSIGRHVQSARFQKWRPYLAAGAVAAVIWVLLSLVGKPASPVQPTLASAVPTAPALPLPPSTTANADAQVALVKSTLKSMGLDPGASGDTGCLVQPQ